MPVRHLLLALAIVAVWGSNFTIVHLAFDHFPPLLFATLRFAFVFVPVALFVRRPAVRWRTIAIYGCLIFAGQFGLMFYAMGGMISAGLASLVVQSQVFFTILFAAWFTGERLRAVQALALAFAFAGMALLVVEADGGTTALGLLLVTAAGLCWAGGNHVARSIARDDALRLTVWATMFAAPLLAVAALVVEGPVAIAQSLLHAPPAAWAAVAWQSIGNTMFGYGMWAWLLSRHSAATVSPLSLLVPVFGIGTSAVILGEPLPAWKLIATGLILIGLVINILASRRKLKYTSDAVMGEPV